MVRGFKPISIIQCASADASNFSHHIADSVDSWRFHRGQPPVINTGHSNTDSRGFFVSFIGWRVRVHRERFSRLHTAPNLLRNHLKSRVPVWTNIDSFHYLGEADAQRLRCRCARKRPSYSQRPAIPVANFPTPVCQASLCCTGHVLRCDYVTAPDRSGPSLYAPPNKHFFRLKLPTAAIAGHLVRPQPQRLQRSAQPAGSI